MSHSIEPIPAVARYFGDSEATPIVTAEFTPGRGWRTTGYAKRISGAWARKLRSEGVTHVSLTEGGRSADFSIEEILRSVNHG